MLAKQCRRAEQCRLAGIGQTDLCTGVGGRMLTMRGRIVVLVPGSIVEKTAVGVEMIDRTKHGHLSAWGGRRAH